MTTGPTPSLRPTSPATLFVAALAAAAGAWVLIGRFYGEMPNLSWFPAVTLALLAALCGLLALQTRARIERRPGAAPVQPLVVARMVVVAKASSLAGAIFFGLYAGALVWLLAQRTDLRARADDLPPAIGGLVAALLVVAAGLWLERACRVPKPPEDDDEDLSHNRQSE